MLHKNQAPGIMLQNGRKMLLYVNAIFSLKMMKNININFGQNQSKTDIVWHISEIWELVHIFQGQISSNLKRQENYHENLEIEL